MNIMQAIEKAKDFEIEVIDARTILINVLGRDITFVIANSGYSLNSIEEVRYIEALKRINQGYPLQYITNKQNFFGLEFYVNEDVLIPQPDTEVLVEQALKIIKNIDKTKVKILDLCTGSGAIAISIKSRCKNKVRMYGSDINEKALNIARKNAKRILNNQDEIDFIQSNMFEKIYDTYDLILSNPPYIKTSEIKNLKLDVQNEPHIALDGGEDGLKYYRIIKEQGIQHIKPGGYLILEIGFNQKDELLKLFDDAICIKDYRGLDRVIVWRKEKI